jgi:hypothetical protein
MMLVSLPPTTMMPVILAISFAVVPSAIASAAYWSNVVIQKQLEFEVEKRELPYHLGTS